MGSSVGINEVTFSSEDSLYILTILKFIFLSRDSLEYTREKKIQGVYTVSNNFFVKDYEIQFDRGEIRVVWRNINGAYFWVIYKNPFLIRNHMSRFLFKVKNLFCKDRFFTNNSATVLSSLNIIFDDFKKRFDIETNFLKYSSESEASNHILYEVHRNFYDNFTFPEYCKFLKLNLKMKGAAYEALLRGYPYYSN